MNGLDEILDFVGLRDPEQKEKFKKGEIENVKELLDAKAKADLEAFKSNEIFINAIKGERDNTKSSFRKMILNDPDFEFGANELEQYATLDTPELIKLAKGKHSSKIKKEHVSPDAHKDQEIINSLNANVNLLTSKLKEYEEVIVPSERKKIEEFKVNFVNEKQLEHSLVEDSEIKYVVPPTTIKKVAFPDFLRSLPSDLKIIKAKDVKKLGYSDLDGISDDEFVVRKVDFDGKIGGWHFNNQHQKVTKKDLWIQYLNENGYLATPTTSQKTTTTTTPNNKTGKDGYVDPSMTALLNSIK